MDKVFKSNPSLKEYFKTSDGKPFYSESAARNHAKALEDKTVVPVKRVETNSTKKGADNTAADTDPISIEMKKIGKMKKADLITYAKETYALELEEGKTVPELVELVKEAVEASLKSKND